MQAEVRDKAWGCQYKSINWDIKKADGRQEAGRLYPFDEMHWA